MSITVTGSRLLTVAAVARRLNVSERTVWRLIASGELPALRLGGPGKATRVDPDELARWLYSNPQDAA